MFNAKFAKEQVQDAVTKIHCTLPMKRKIVGTRFLFTKDEFDAAKSVQLQSKMTYCTMVIKAMDGQSVRANFDNFGCFGGARALGIVDPDELYTSGRYFATCGLYQDLATAKDVASRMSICKHRAYGVEIRPVEEFDVAPDVVLIVANPRCIMRLVQGYTYCFGTHSDHKMIGNQAICAECTACPYETNDINVSLLCSGPRTAGMHDDELGLGIPFNRFLQLADGLCKTINPVEFNPIKKQIQENFDQNGIEDVPIVYNVHYSDGFFKRDLAYFESLRTEREQQLEKNVK